MTALSRTLVIRVAVHNREDPQGDLSYFLADVRAALTSDVTRGGYARDTKITSTDTYQTEDGSAICAADATVTIRYAHQYDDPTVPF